MAYEVIIPPDTTPPPDRTQSTPDKIAADLMAGIQANPTLAAAYTVTRFGSTLKIVKNAGGDSADINIVASDSLLDEGLSVIKGVVPSVTDLPRTCEDDFVLRVQGDPLSAADDAWFIFKSGRWDEAPTPDTTVELDNQRMPWVLASTGTGGARSFTFGPATWSERSAGDDTNNPLPDLPTVDVLFGYEGRLCMTAGANIIASRVGDPTTMFRRTVTQLLADEAINVRSTASPEASFHAALQWDGGLYLWSDRAQVRLSGEPALSPTTIALDVESHFENDPTVPPIILGSSVYFVRRVDGTTRVFEYYRPPGYGAPPATNDVTAAVPTYLSGTPRELVGDEAFQFLAVRCGQSVYACHFTQRQNTRVPRWHTWTFPGTTLANMRCLGGKLYLFGSRGLESLDVTQPADTAAGVPMDASGTVEFTPTATLGDIFLAGERGPITDGRFTIRNLTLFHHSTSDGTLTVDGEATPRVTWEAGGPKAIRVPLHRNAADLVLTLSWFGAITGIELQGTYITRNQHR